MWMTQIDLRDFFSREKLKKTIPLVVVIVLLFPFATRIGLPIVNRVLGSPDLSILEDYQPIGSIEIYDYQDNFVDVLQGKEDRLVIKLNQISDYMKQAVLAAEDADFYHHSGFSLSAFFRALMTNLKAGRVVQGGSTITQQMVKNLFIREDERYRRTLSRKVVELLIAFEVESKYNKDKILEIYLNQVYFGNRAYGVERAAQRYFSKPASKLSLVEASYLAGLLTAPSYLSKNLDKATERQQYVLKSMLDHGYISQSEYQNAVNTKLQFKESPGNFDIYPYYFSFVEQELLKRFTRNELKKTGLKVYTGMDPAAQKIAQQKLNEGILNAAYGINQGALVSIDVETGEIRVLVGGVGNYWQYQYNRAVNVHTIGSAFKPFVYLTAFMNGVVDPDTIVKDEPITFEDLSSPTKTWTPHNFDDEFHGPISVRSALVFSRNIPAVKVASKTGIRDIIRTAELAGLKTNMEPVLSLALGAQAFTPLEVANAYATLARGGTYMSSILIRKITDAKGRVLEVNKAVPKSALPERYVGQLVDIMQDVTRYGTGALANIPGRVMAGKTGTADGSRDIWFIGFTPDTVTAVWAGNERNKEVLSRYATGGSTPAWIWREFMTEYLKERPRPVRNFSFSKNYIDVAIDPLTGLLATEYTPQPVIQRFIPGTEPTRYAPTPDAGDDIRTRKEGQKRFFDMALGKFAFEEKKLKKAEEYEEESEQEDLDKKLKQSLPKIIPKPKPFKITQEEDQNAAAPPKEESPQ
jgi:1A family penicillin-binding protein